MFSVISGATQTGNVREAAARRPTESSFDRSVCRIDPGGEGRLADDKPGLGRDSRSDRHEICFECIEHRVRVGGSVIAAFPDGTVTFPDWPRGPGAPLSSCATPSCCNHKLFELGGEVQTVKGMVQVGGTTYRIERLNSGAYHVVRIADDTRVGTFQSVPRLLVTSTHIEPALMHEIAQSAVRAGKTSWVGRLDIPEK